MFKLSKQPSEVLVGVSIDFAARLGADETLIGGTVTPSVLSGTSVAAVTITDDGPLGSTVVATVSGGTTKCTYKLTYLATGSMGNILESEIVLTVKEL